MKFSFSLLLILFLGAAGGLRAQPQFIEPFNPFYICHSNFEQHDYFFYGEIISVENLENVSVKLSSRLTGALFKAVVKVNRSFKGKLPSKITLYIGYNASGQRILAKNSYLFQAEEGKLAEQQAYFTEVISRPMTDYSNKAVKEVFTGIDSILGIKTDNFVEGLVYERLLKVRDVTIKREDADRLVRDFQNSKPLANILVEVTGEGDGNFYKVTSDRNGRFRIENIIPGLYKIKLYLPADKEQTEPLIYSVGSTPCSRKWFVPVMPKSP
jgi:hypothetical protein